jgi:2-polyprenyl-6-methoxyphenol hydroxylase-like FAD-dependent oxidoreductase
MTATPEILIVGAGIGGLTAAIALRQAGFHAEVFERTAELKEVGAGIALSANATRVLEHLGIMQQVLVRGTAIEAAVTLTPTGRTLLRMPTNLADAPSVCLHRADLQRALLSSLPPNCVHLGEEFVEFEQTDNAVTVRFASGRTACGGAVIGADGLRSRVRAQLVGDGEPVYRGYQCWRGVCRFPVSSVLTETLGAGVRVGLLPVGPHGTAWWCTVNEPELAGDPGGLKAKLLQAVGDWHSPIPEVIGGTEPAQIIKSAMYDRQPVKTWSKGRCALLGDAAHPTTPNMGQGGCMAIEDAVVLARCLSRYGDPETAFGIYERLRYSRTAQITKLSRFYGQIGQWSNPGAGWLRNSLLRLVPKRIATNGYLTFVGYDPYQVAV